MTENGWMPVAIKRIDEAMFNIEFDSPDRSGFDCPVCDWVRTEYDPNMGTGLIPCWTGRYAYCPASRSCKEFSYILDDMKQKSAKIRRLKALKAKLEGAE